MKLLVYGAGVCGSLFAALMHEAGHDVTLLARTNAWPPCVGKECSSPRRTALSGGCRYR
ncbi:2-dehydropantoate 2-reductase N-terminal domain-containing protein [Streptomyces sp. NPDC010273]|uniref:2-dehydropantoate 2-reductase N-terminal domain-containing protein n=1 Tax=Streptomyces sp. NPDC010273 TaxID=3364829 RepID=UPI0036E4678A